MTVRHLHRLLADLDDTYEVVVVRGRDGNVLAQVWRAAEDEAGEAYRRWAQRPGADAYAGYRAAADRADAALAALTTD